MKCFISINSASSDLSTLFLGDKCLFLKFGELKFSIEQKITISASLGKCQLEEVPIGEVPVKGLTLKFNTYTYDFFSVCKRQKFKIINVKIRQFNLLLEIN